jgi:hypothetical protein
VKAQAQADVINFHGGRAGYHPELYKAHLAEWMAVNNEDATTGASDARQGKSKDRNQAQSQKADDDEKGVAFAQAGEKSGEKSGKHNISTNHDCFSG